MVHRSAQSTRGGGRPKSGEGDLGLPMKFCQVRGLGKLHGPMAELTEALVRERACTRRRGCANGREPEVSATVEHVCPLPLPMF
jgi:hypothetical protein